MWCVPSISASSETVKQKPRESLFHSTLMWPPTCGCGRKRASIQNPVIGYSPAHILRAKYPFWPDILLLKIIQPAARRAGIKKRIGWHTFRHSYSSLLVANGENVKVVQELMRHASSRFTLDVYSQAWKGAKRQAQQRVVQMILPENFDDAVPEISLEGARNDVE
jgi:stress-induced morphogen